jgi:hypothetical protein
VKLDNLVMMIHGDNVDAQSATKCNQNDVKNQKKTMTNLLPSVTPKYTLPIRKHGKCLHICIYIFNNHSVFSDNLTCNHDAVANVSYIFV